MKGWAKALPIKSQKLEKYEEEEIMTLFEHNEVGLFTKEEVLALKELKRIKNNLLEKEVEWRLKSKGG